MRMTLTAKNKVPTGARDAAASDVGTAVRARAMFFVWELFLRLESFVSDCPSYTRRFDSALAVVFSYTALALYILFFALCRLYRGAVIAGFVVGFSLSGALVFLFGTLIPKLHHSAAPCALDTDNRAAEDATIVVYSAVFVIAYEYAFPSTKWTTRNCGRVLKYVVVASGVIVAGIASPYSLGVQTGAALAVGSSAGIAAAVVTILALTHISRLSPTQREFSGLLFDTTHGRDPTQNNSYAQLAQDDSTHDTATL